MKKLKIKVGTIDFSSDELHYAVKEAVRDYIREEYRDKIASMVRAEVQNLVNTEIQTSIKKEVKNAVKDFTSKDGFLVTKDAYSTERIRFNDYFKKVFSDTKKFSLDKEGQVRVESYGGHPLIDLFTIQAIQTDITVLVKKWVDDNEKHIKDNINTVVSNNIKKSLFGTKLPDEKLMNIASPLADNNAVESSIVDENELPF